MYWKELFFITVACFAFSACDTVKPLADQAIKAGTDAVLNSQSSTASNKPSNTEVINALKEALEIGVNNSVNLVSKLDGFYKNPLILIPFPPDAIKVKEKVDALGMSAQTNKFVETINRAAEEASKTAAPVFIEAIKNMSIEDGYSILNGNNTAATDYLSNKTTEQLKISFSPIVKNAIDKVELTKYWKPIINTYNRIPSVQTLNPDLEKYVTERAILGLFKLVAEEELKIRKDPVARVTELLKKVFGSVQQ
jgi:Protein of unknown function (DUF4197)